ncbi:hypothetical protein BDZ97DRAFT_2075060, partial [Flammula alnicola]
CTTEAEAKAKATARAAGGEITYPHLPLATASWPHSAASGLLSTTPTTAVAPLVLSPSLVLVSCSHRCSRRCRSTVAPYSYHLFVFLPLLLSSSPLLSPAFLAWY